MAFPLLRSDTQEFFPIPQLEEIPYPLSEINLSTEGNRTNGPLLSRANKTAEKKYINLIFNAK